ncbi:MAG: lysophospholipid acyltransferase family protein [Kiritimatiellia bacterium]|jgi:lauroyl/myristoyl acyltransferase
MNLYIPYRIAQFICQKLPRPFAYWLGMRIADCFYLCDRKGRRAVRRNLRQIMHYLGRTVTPRQLSRMARKNFEHFGKYLVDFFKCTGMSIEDVNRLVDMENFHYLPETRAKGKGVIILTAHFGNWELGAAIVTALGYRLSAVFQPERTRSVNRLFLEHRTNRGIKAIPLGRAARGVIKVLKNQGLVAMLADRDFSAHDNPIDFFGAPAQLPSGPARLAMRMGVPVLPIFLSRKPDDRFLLRCYPPLMPTDFQSLDELRQHIRDILQEEIAQNPLQWFIFEDFWRKGKI